jgi:Rps23 Pro-64 3,4-dihydroxylase Tpa1-like proline 4-hydroxylase
MAGPLERQRAIPDADELRPDPVVSDAHFHGEEGDTRGNMFSLDNNVLNFEYLSGQKLRDGYRSGFAAARPFRHLVFDDLVSEHILDGILDEFCRVAAIDWVQYETQREMNGKRGTRPNARLGAVTQAYISAIHSGPFVDFLTEITGIKGLLPDPTLMNGGLHEISPGGKFAVHVDFNRHSITGLDNRLIFITYLNRGWQPSYGGALELWSAEQGRCVVEVQPLFGRSILFEVSPQSWHGHPVPFSAPDGSPRRSIAAYYYTNGREDAALAEDHSSIFMVRNRRDKVAALLRAMTPPIVIDFGRRFRRRS